MQYCLYLRKSRSDMEAEAHGEGETLARHEKMLLELARRGNYNVTQIYREVVSGETLAARPVMQQLLSEVEQGLWAGVLVMEVERLARGDTIDQGIVAQAFKYSDTKIITPMKVYDPANEFDEEYFEFGLFMSRREYKTINRRLQRGRLAASKEGKRVSGAKPYGYNRVKISGDKGWTLEVNEDEADVVRMIFRIYTTGEEGDDGSVRSVGTGEIARRLDALGIPSPSGAAAWPACTVRNILLNPVYIGKIRWNHKKSRKVVENGVVTVNRYNAPEEEWVLVDGMHPAIISDEVFRRAGDIMKHRTPALGGEKSLTNPLAGILVCGRCGRTLSLTPHPTWPMLRCINRYCSCPGSRFDLVEARLLGALSGWLGDFRINWEDDGAPDDVSRVSEIEKKLKLAEAQLSRLKGMLNRTHELLEQGVYDTGQFLDRSRSLSGQISEAEKVVRDLGGELSVERRRGESKANIVPKVEHLLEVYRALPNAQAKNDLLKEVLEKVVYDREKKSRKGGPYDEFELTLYPKLPPIE